MVMVKYNQDSLPCILEALNFVPDADGWIETEGKRIHVNEIVGFSDGKIITDINYFTEEHYNYIASRFNNIITPQ